MSASHTNSRIAVCPICDSKVALAGTDLVPGYNGRYTHYSCLKKALAEHNIILPEVKPDWVQSPAQACEFFYTLIQIYDLVFAGIPVKEEASNAFWKIFKYFGWYSDQNHDIKKALSTYKRKVDIRYCACCGLPIALDSKDVIYGQDGKSFGHYSCYRNYLAATGVDLDDQAPELDSSDSWRRYFVANFKHHFTRIEHQPAGFVRLQLLAFNEVFSRFKWSDEEISQIVF